MSRTTRAFENPLSDAGVTFEGFKTIKITSRETVREKLEDFLTYCSAARKPAIRIILGEWGEGKTDTYRRYISPEWVRMGNSALFCSASTLANSYEDPDVQTLFETTNLEAVRFLIAMLNAIREEEKTQDIPSPKRQKSAELYVNETLSQLLKKKSKIIVFVDEFEELLLHQSILRRIISGIKEIVNGYPKTIDEGGKFSGCLHLVIAATPDAFYRLAVSDHTSLIFGGLGRRAGVILLPQIRKSESVKFLFDLLVYSYGGKLPTPPPLENLGILQALAKISQGNPGTMVSLFTRLLNSARDRGASKRIKVVDYELLLRFLENERIFIYGGETPCLEKEAYWRILKFLGEQRQGDTARQASELFRILLAEIRPFSAKELALRLQVSETHAKNLVNIVNGELKTREKIERTILKVSKLRKEKSIPDVLKAFKEYTIVEHDTESIKIDNYSESIADFEDRLMFFELESEGISSSIFLPSDPPSILIFFDGISRERSTEINNMINRHLIDEEDYYVASDELLSQIYPTPVPRELECVRNRDFRLSLWRDVTKSLVDQYNQCMPDALLDLIRRAGVAQFSEIRAIGPNRAFQRMIFRDALITALVVAINGDVKSSDIEDASRWMKSNTPPTLCCMIVYTGEITIEAEEKITNKELGEKGDNLVLPVRLHPTLAKRIIAVHQALATLSNEQLDETLLKGMLERVVTQDLDFYTIVDRWLKEQQERGVAIRDIKIESTSNLREFADSLKFFINFLETKASPREIYAKNQRELLEFVRYNSRLGLIPDIELPKFERMIEDLFENGFLKKHDRNTYSAMEHPVEVRLLKILGRFQKLADTELEQHFIAAVPKFLRDVFIPILEYKGRVVRSGHNLELSDLQKLRSDVQDEFESFRRMSEKADVRNFGLAYQWKKKGDHRYISLRQFETYVDGLERRAKDQLKGREEFPLQKLCLLKRLLRYFQEEFIPLFDKAAQSASQVQIDSQSKYEVFESEVKKVREKASEWLKLRFLLANLTEYAQATRAHLSIATYLKSDEKQLRDLMSNFTDAEAKKFYFDENEDEAWYFNPKLYYMSKSAEELVGIVDHASSTALMISAKFDELDAKRKGIADRMPSPPKSSQEISVAVRHEVIALSKDIVRNIEPVKLESASLGEIRSYTENNYPLILRSLDTLEKAVDALIELSEQEMELLSIIEQSKALEESGLRLLDVQELKGLVTELTGEIESSKKEYQALTRVDKFEAPDELVIAISATRDQMKTISGRLQIKSRAIEEGLVKFSSNVRKTLETIESALRILSKRRNFETDVLRKEISELRNKVQARSLTELLFKTSDIEEQKIHVLEKFYESVNAILSKKEAQVFNAIIEQSKQNRKSWLIQEDVYHIGNQMKIDRGEMNKILRKLADLQLITIGVCLPT